LYSSFEEKSRFVCIATSTKEWYTVQTTTYPLNGFREKPDGILQAHSALLTIVSVMQAMGEVRFLLQFFGKGE
jgi:hypothetical protein